MTKGVILLAYSKPEYIFMAAHLIASIKQYSPNLNIAVLCDNNIGYMPDRYKAMIDKTIPVDSDHLLTHGQIDPGKAKCSIIPYLPYDQNLYLDVDGLCLQDLEPIFNTDKDFCVEVCGEGTKSDDINYNHWATTDDEWNEFSLPEDATFRTVQSSAMYFKKGKFCDKLQKHLDKCLNFPMSKLKNNWGKHLPDELIYSGAVAQLGYDPSFENPVCFFGHKKSPLSFTELQEKYYVLSMYGNGKGATLVKDAYRDWYNRLNNKLHKTIGLQPIREIHSLMKGKHVG